MAFALHLIMQISLASIFIELLNSEIDTTKQLLYEEIMDEKGMNFIGVYG